MNFFPKVTRIGICGGILLFFACEAWAIDYQQAKKMFLESETPSLKTIQHNYVYYKKIVWSGQCLTENNLTYPAQVITERRKGTVGPNSDPYIEVRISAKLPKDDGNFWNFKVYSELISDKWDIVMPVVNDGALYSLYGAPSQGKADWDVGIQRLRIFKKANHTDILVAKLSKLIPEEVSFFTSSAKEEIQERYNKQSPAVEDLSYCIFNRFYLDRIPMERDTVGCFDQISNNIERMKSSLVLRRVLGSTVMILNPIIGGAELVRSLVQDSTPVEQAQQTLELLQEVTSYNIHEGPIFNKILDQVNTARRGMQLKEYTADELLKLLRLANESYYFCSPNLPHNIIPSIAQIAASLISEVLSSNTFVVIK